MKITIKTIPHAQQRYPTCGDWILKPDHEAHILVSSLSDWRSEALVAVHELVEVLLCQHRGITQAAVDAFDKAYERDRPDGDDSEPGNDPQAPYRKEHFFATNVERLLAAELDVNFQDYEKELSSLG